MISSRDKVADQRDTLSTRRINTSKINNPCSSILNRAKPRPPEADEIDDCRTIEALIVEVSKRRCLCAINFATLDLNLGINPHTSTVSDFSGRPHYPVDNDFQSIKELA